MKIKISIECGKRNCNNCEYTVYPRLDDYHQHWVSCAIFGKPLLKTNNQKNAKRCKECIKNQIE